MPPVRLLIAAVDETTLPFRALALQANGDALILWPRMVEVRLSWSQVLTSRAVPTSSESPRLGWDRTARIVLDDGTTANGSSGWLDDSVVLVDWPSGEEASSSPDGTSSKDPVQRRGSPRASVRKTNSPSTIWRDRTA